MLSSASIASVLSNFRNSSTLTYTNTNSYLWLLYTPAPLHATALNFWLWLSLLASSRNSYALNEIRNCLFLFWFLTNFSCFLVLFTLILSNKWMLYYWNSSAKIYLKVSRRWKKSCISTKVSWRWKKKHTYPRKFHGDEKK